MSFLLTVRMWVSLRICNEPWLLKLKQRERPMLRCVYMYWVMKHLLCSAGFTEWAETCWLLSPGDFCKWREECIWETSPGCWHHRRVPSLPSAALPPDTQHHISREQPHLRLPTTRWFADEIFFKVVVQTMYLPGWLNLTNCSLLLYIRLKCVDYSYQVWCT